MLTEKEKKQVAKYEEDFALSKWKYILSIGLAFGILMTISTAITDIVFNKVSLSRVLSENIWIHLITGVGAGLFYALIIRWFSLRSYRKLKSKEAA